MRFAALLLSSLLMPAVCPAVDYPAHKGYVSDFAEQLAPGDQQALESRLRAFERKTSIEVAVAIVPSLEGESVETYATGLFRSWGIGKQGKNNGVLFLWAPNERKLRIEVGYGLESSISNAAAADILRETSALFREQRYAQGLQTAVGGILSRLDASGAGSGESPVSGDDGTPSRAGLWLVGALAIAVAVAVIAVIRRRRARMLQLQAEVPQLLQGLDSSVAQAEASLKQAAADLEALKSESPSEVWAGISESLAAAPAEFAKLRENAAAIRRQPRQEYGELRGVSRSLHEWQSRLARESSAFENVGATLRDYRFRKDESEKLLGTLASSLDEFSARYSAGALPDRAETLLPAARETYSNAVSAASENPVNWFLVYDLLTDVQECLDRIQNSYQWSRRPRTWYGNDLDSPALAAMALLFASSSPGRRNSGSDSTIAASDLGGDGGWSGGSDSGGGDFGGGDSGGSGASDSY